MRSRSGTHPLVRAATILGLAICGLVGGHALGYAIAAPDLVHRNALLLSTGHSYLPSASWLALVAGAAAIVTGLATGRSGRDSTHLSYRGVAVRMCAMQCTGFVLLEITERLISSSPIHTLSLPLLLIGLATQLVCAALLAFVVVGVRRIGAAVGSSVAVADVCDRDELVVVVAVAPRSCDLSLSRVRGPPSLSMA